MEELETPFPKINQSKRKVFTAKLMLRGFLYAFAILGVLFIILISSLIGFLKKDSAPVKPVAPNAVLYIDFSNVYNETRNDDLLTDVAGVNSMSYLDLVSTITAAALDDRIKALVADINTTNLGLAQVQDLRKVIKNFRAEGKTTIAYSTGFGAFGGGMKPYYLASAFDEIWMQPDSEIGITGISIEVPFVKELLGKIGAEPEFYTRYEYKNAMASLVNSKFSKEHKQDLTKMADGIFNQIVEDVAKDRELSVKDLKKLIDNAPIFVKNTDSKLVDVVDYRPNLWAKVNKIMGLNSISLEDYNQHFERDKVKLKNVIAFLVLDGVIEDGYSENKPFGDSIIGAKSVLAQLEEIAKDKKVKALIVRINSPGGSYAASNEIWYAIKKIKETKNIPVIVSMSDYAASGGYFIALSGDYIFAEPSTITGSIGVLGGKIVLADLWKKIGVNWDVINIGKNAGALSMNRKFSASERKIFNRSLDNIYSDFTTKVAENRNIEMSKMNSLARGRVWLGSGAKEHNLIDGIGGVDEAITKAVSMAGKNKDYSLVYYPKTKTIQEKLAELVGGKNSRIESSQILSNFGIDINELNMLKRFEYDTMLVPFKMSM